MDVALAFGLAILGTVIGTIGLELMTGRRMDRHFREERMRKVRGLRAELAENSLLETTGSWRKAPFATDVWEDTKGILADPVPQARNHRANLSGYQARNGDL